MKYLIRLFLEADEKVYETYEFDHLPYMPRIGETITVGDMPCEVMEIISSFDQLSNGQFMVDYMLHEVER